MKINIMFGMLITIINKDRVTANELSLKFEISKRTVLRYVDALCSAQIPLITHPGRRGGISVADNFSLDRVYFTGQELKRLFDCVNGMLNIFDDDVTKSVNDKLQSITFKEKQHILASQTVFIDSGPWGDIKSYQGKFSALEKSIDLCLPAEIIYHDSNNTESSRTIHPYTLVFKTGIWYVYAFCTLRNNFRLFKIGRIARITLQSEPFVKQNIDISSLPYNINWFKNENNINVVLEVSQNIRSDVEEWLSFENVKKNKDGKIYAFARLPENGLIQKLLSFGSNIKVIEPAEIKTKLLKTVSGIENLYKEDNIK